MRSLIVMVGLAACFVLTVVLLNDQNYIGGIALGISTMTAMFIFIEDRGF